MPYKDLAKRRECNRKNQKRYQAKHGVRAKRDYRIIIVSLLRDIKGELCGICHDFLGDSLVEIDHINPIAVGGGHASDNLQLTHRSCNRAKGKKSKN